MFDVFVQEYFSLIQFMCNNKSNEIQFYGFNFPIYLESWEDSKQPDAST